MSSVSDTSHHVVRAVYTIDNIKWAAAVAMVLDHVNKYLLDGSVGWMYAIGRSAFPMFVGVLAYKLSRCSTEARERMIGRLLAAAVLSMAPYIGMGRGALAFGWWPLPVLWTLCAVVVLIHVSDSGLPGAVRWLASLTLFVVGGGVGEFWWPGVGLGLSLYWLFKQPSSIGAGAGVCVSFIGLCWINGTAWGLASVPCALVAARLRALPSWQLGFYAFYPGHLAVLWVYRSWLAG